MDQKDLKVKNLESLLAEATAQNELNKLVEETSVDEVEGTKLPDGTTDSKPEEGAPEVKTDDVIETVDSDKDVEGHDNKELQEETSVDEVEGTQLPDGTTETKPEEGNPEVKSDDVLDTADSSEDVEGHDNKELTEETSVDEVEGTKLPEGTLETKPEEGNPEVKTDDVIETVDSDKDVEGHDNKELQEETSVDEVEGVKLPEGTLEKEPEEGNPEVKSDDVLETVDSDKDVEGHDNKELQEETSVDEVEGVKLPEGTLEKEPEAGAPEVKTDDVIETVDSDKDVEGHDNKELQEAIDSLNEFIESLNEAPVIADDNGNNAHWEDKKVDLKKTTSENHSKQGDVKVVSGHTEDGKTYVQGETDEDEKKLKEKAKEALKEETSVDEVEGTQLPDGTTETKPEEGAPAVTTDTVIETVDSDKDVEGHENEDKAPEKAPEAKKFEAADAVEATGGEEKSPLANLEKGNDYHSLKEAVKLGTARFETEEEKAALSEQITVLLAAENNDLLYEEYARHLSEAKALREAINKKYAEVANTRTGNLLESMTIAEEKIAAHKNDMFKKLHEQQEVNAAVKDAQPVTADEAAFGE